MSTVCDDLRCGGILSSSGITGGTSINSTAIQVADWSGLFGTPGLASQPVEVSGRPGAIFSGDGLPRQRLLTLNSRITRESGGQELWDNTDTFLGLVAAVGGNYLEVDLPDGTSRFLHVRSLDPASITQRLRRNVGIPLVSADPYWKAGGTESSDTISSGDTLVTGGNANVYDAVLVFAGDGTFTHNGLGWSLEISGSGGAVTVDLGERTVTEGGNPADDLLIRDNKDWGWFTPGNNSVTADVSVAVTWRDSWL